MTPEDIVAEARTWLGTPFHHQARVKGVGVDCGGVVEQTAKSFRYAPEYFESDDFRVDYSRQPDGTMIRILEKYFDRVPRESRQIADVIVVAWSMIPQHLGILTESGTMIHAYGQRGVVETTLTGSHLNGVRGVFRWRY